MSKLTARNALVVIGLCALSRMLAYWVAVLIAVMHFWMTFTGDVGVMMMWVWQRLPYDLFAALAAITLIEVIETEKPLPWVGVLAASYLYGEGMHAWRALTHGWLEPPRTSDYIGSLTQAIIPTLACLFVGIWWTRRREMRKAILT